MASSQARRPDSATAAIDRLFTRFGAIYGSRFTDAWAGVDVADMKRAWFEQLRGFRAEEVGAAAEHCAKYVRFPPTLPEFVEIVRGYVAPPPAIEHKRMTKEEIAQARVDAAPAIARCKQVIAEAEAKHRRSHTPHILAGALAGISYDAEAVAERAAIQAIEQGRRGD